MAKKRGNKKPGILFWAPLLVFIGVFVFSAYKLGSQLLANIQDESQYKTLRTEVEKPLEDTPVAPTDPSVEETTEAVGIDFEHLKSINEEVVAWIKCEGMEVDYPVMQTTDNSYYLTHLYNRKKSSRGSVFVDFRVDSIYSDKNVIMYGHNLKNGKMLACLLKYKKQSFYEAHKTMTLYTPDGDYLIELISGTVEDGNNEFVRFDLKDNDKFIKYIESLKKRSSFKSNVGVSKDDRIVSIVTCSREKENARYMLVGKLTKIEN